MRPYFSAGHVRLAGLGHEERALEVHVHDGVPVGLGHLEDQVVADDARVVDEHDGRAELVGHPGDAGLDLRGVGDVDPDPDGAAAGVADPRGDRLAGRLVEVEHRHGEPVAAEPLARWRPRCLGPLR